ncbi:DNA-binding protein BIN4 [Zea mays]|uniref:DNA-binding protein BIN4 n=2 Tax=Zea mays TaxID=4577 RepID=A0A1D6H0U2_MAIZE|nr:DNA-binding protein BIN4 [Zea mays]PWZ20794.1 DNA-binding protein BIN4 [Zea mays]
MGDEEDDPDWLRAFQAPTVAPVMLSSGSDTSPEASPTRTSTSRKQNKGEKHASPDHARDRDGASQNKNKISAATRRKNLVSKKEGSTMDEKQANTPRRLVWILSVVLDSLSPIHDILVTRLTPKKDMVTLSSGSDASPGNSLSRAHEDNHEEGSLSTAKRKNAQQTKTKKTKDAGTKTGADQAGNGDAEDDVQDKLTGNSVSQRLPLIFPDKVQRSKALIECDGDSIDLSGDIGAVGRIVVSNGPTAKQDLLLDLKGTIYKTTIVPSRTFCVVSYVPNPSRDLLFCDGVLTLDVFSFQIEAIMNDFIQLEPQSNLFEAETMVEGTLDGFTFDSDEEGDKLYEPQANQNDLNNNEDEGQPKAKTKRKAEKTTGKAPKKAKVAGKGPKKGTRKTQPAKRGRKAKK